MSIRARTYLLVLLPLSGLLFFVAWGWVERSGAVDDAVHMGERIELLSATGELVHAVQLERGWTAGWLAGTEEAGLGNLMELRLGVDERMSEFRRQLDRIAPTATVARFEEAGQRALASANLLSEVRLSTDRREISGARAAAAYTVLNENLLELARAAVHGVAHPELTSHAGAYTTLLRLKETAGLERAVVHAALLRGGFLPGERDTVVALAASQDALRLDLGAASEALPYDLTLGEEGHPSTRRALGVREAVLRDGPTLPDGAAEGWFEAQTERIEHLRDLEHRALRGLEEEAAGLESRTRRERNGFALAGFAIVLLTLGGAARSAAAIRGPLGRLHDALERVGRGDGEARHARLEEAGPSEITAIARSFNRYADRIERLLERAEASEAKFSGILEVSVDAIISVDEEQRIVLFNHGAESIFGYAEEEVLGEPLDILLPERHREVHREHVEVFADSAVGARRMAERGEISGRRKDGEEFPAEASISKLETGGGRLLTVVLQDVTERRRAEEELARYAEELERSNAELEQFAYVASHDLQEPLRMVGSYTQLLARRYQGRLDEDADEFIAYAVDGVNRMRALINDLLTYSRVGRRNGAFGSTDLGAVLDRTLANVKVAVGENEAAVTRDPLPTIHGDEGQLVQLFQNLLVNALRFRSEAPPRIHVSAAWSEAEGGWVVSVRDNGIGMEPEHLERIFRIFQRLHGHGRYPGTGIGLAIARKIVERHGGRIWAESEPGRGSTFRFTLPDGGER